MKASANHILIENNTFEGQMIDGISIASGTSYTTINNNTFIDVCYSVYFGGAVTKTTIENNSFINCGYCKGSDGSILFGNLPIISAQKSASNLKIRYNEFRIGHNDSVLIIAESANDAHGYPSAIGDILISENNIVVDDEVNPNTVRFVYLYSNAGALDPFEPISIVNNTIAAGVKPVVVWYGSPADWGDPDNPYFQPAQPVATFMSVKEMYTADGTLMVALTDVNGNPLVGCVIRYIINDGDSLNETTDMNGIITLKIENDALVNFVYDGNSSFKSSTASINFTSTHKEKEATEIICSDMVTSAVYPKEGRIGKYFKVTLASGNGELLTGKEVLIGFKGVVYNHEDGLVTDENGVVQLQINLGYKGVYTFAIAFLGDKDYNSSFVVSKITVNTQKGTLTVPNKSYSASAKTKTLTATFKSAGGKLVEGKKVTFTVNGKTYTAKTNSKGVASVNVSLNKKGTYSFTVKFAGDSTFSSISKSAKLTIK